MKQRFVTFAFLTLFAATNGAASPVWTEAAKVQTLIDSVVGDANQAQATIGQLANVLQLEPAEKAFSAPEAPVFSSTQPGKLISADLQLVMTQLSIHIGSNNQIRILRAQGDRRDALILQSGVSSLHDLAIAAQTQGLDGIRLKDGIVQLTRPLVVWLGAGLKLEPGDRLEMDAASGAFLLGFGQIEMAGADVRATQTNSMPEAYRPFVLTTGQGTLYAKDTKFAGLGMVGADPFGGVVISTRGLFPPEFPPALTHNTFEDMAIVSMVGVADGVIANNLFKSGRGGGISLVSVQRTRIVGNAVIGTKSGAGIKITNGSDMQISGNFVARGARNGLWIGGNSKGVEISGNAVVANAETGIAAQRATCVLVNGNSVASNGASGLRLNESGLSRVEGNAVILNANSGIQVGAQLKGGRIEVSDNLLAGNRVGLTGVAVGEVILDQNNLSNQMPRLFGGEFSQYLAAYLTQVQRQSDKFYRISAVDGQEADAFLSACKRG